MNIYCRESSIVNKTRPMSTEAGTETGIQTMVGGVNDDIGF